MIGSHVPVRAHRAPFSVPGMLRCALQACSEQRGYSYKRGHLVRLRRSKVTIKDDGEPWYPGDQRDRN